MHGVSHHLHRSSLYLPSLSISISAAAAEGGVYACFTGACQAQNQTVLLGAVDSLKKKVVKAAFIFPSHFSCLASLYIFFCASRYRADDPGWMV